MTNNLKIVLISIIVLFIGITGYMTLVKKLPEPVENKTIELPITQESIIENVAPYVDGVNGLPVITSISPVSGPIGTKVRIEGRNLAGFETDFDVNFVRNDGLEIPQDVSSKWGERSCDEKQVPEKDCITFTLRSYCLGNLTIGSYSGELHACETKKITPGVYKVYAKRIPEKSNEVSFTITDENVEIKVYFINKTWFTWYKKLIQAPDECNALIVMPKIIPKTEKVATAAINKLLEGPDKKMLQFSSNIPVGAKLNSLTITNGEARADFNDVLASNDDGCSMTGRIAQIRETLLQFPTVKTVIISVNGKIL